MPSFRIRSDQKELLDGDAIPFDAIRINMEELDYINRKLGGHRVTTDGVSKLTKKKQRTWHICEIGCGGADNLRAIKHWAAKNKLSCTLSGVDINPECITYAKAHPGNSGINFIQSDYRDLQFEEKPDIIFSSLFCHHFTDDELATQLQWMEQESRTGFFINDLHRHPLAYYSIKMLTRAFSRSPLVKNDAPLSVLRSFKKNDWTRIFQSVGLTNFNCTWQWAFRWLITYQHEAGS